CRRSWPPSRRSSPAAATSDRPCRPNCAAVWGNVMHEGKLDMITGIDHFVLTVASLEVTCDFYQRVLGFERVDMPDLPTALAFGTQKINVHEVSRTFEP